MKDRCGQAQEHFHQGGQLSGGEKIEIPKSTSRNPLEGRTPFAAESISPPPRFRAQFFLSCKDLKVTSFCVSVLATFCRLGLVRWILLRAFLIFFLFSSLLGRVSVFLEECIPSTRPRPFLSLREFFLEFSKACVSARYRLRDDRRGDDRGGGPGEAGAQQSAHQPPKGGACYGKCGRLRDERTKKQTHGASVSVSQTDGWTRQRAEEREGKTHPRRRTHTPGAFAHSRRLFFLAKKSASQWGS